MDSKDLPIGTPCMVDWRAMKPSEKGRFCGDCKKVVHDLSRLRERDARELVQSAKHGELCVRYVFDRHGKVFFAGDQAPMLIPAALLHRAKRLAFGAAAIALQACNAPLNDGGGEMMGDIAMPEITQPFQGDDAGEGGTDGGTKTHEGSDASPRQDAGDAGPDATADAETPI
jgi:hypothetical protein